MDKKIKGIIIRIIICMYIYAVLIVCVAPHDARVRTKSAEVARNTRKFEKISFKPTFDSMNI